MTDVTTDELKLAIADIDTDNERARNEIKQLRDVIADIEAQRGLYNSFDESERNEARAAKEQLIAKLEGLIDRANSQRETFVTHLETQDS